MIYSVDTSGVIGAWRKRLPPDVVPSFWSRLRDSILAGDVRAIDEVRREIEKKDDDVKAWAATQPELFVEMTEEVWDAAHTIIARFPELTKPMSDRNAADPFVVAFAQVHRAAVITVSSALTGAAGGASRQL